MKKFIVSILISLTFFAACSVQRVSAEIRTARNGNVQIAQDEVVDDDLFIGAQSAVIEGTVNGDVFVGAQTLRVTGTINGNLHAGASSIFLGGAVTGNVYAGGQNIILSAGNIGGSVIAGGATMDIDRESVIDGSVLAGAGSVNINAAVGRNVMVGAGNLVLGENATIGKDLFYAAGDKKDSVMIADTTKIGGTIHKKVVETPKKQPETLRREALAVFSFFKIASTIISFIGALIIGYLYMKFFPTESGKVKELIKTSFWKCFGIGFLLSIALVPGIIFLFITIIGIPLVGLVLLLAGLYAYLSTIAMGMVAGDWLVHKMSWKTTSYKTFVLGLAAFYLLKMIPALGFVLGLAIWWIGTGAFTIRLFTKK
ncbi:MAG: polymer-forming cytoskeletal protein [Patescibacteria group bacterium]